MDCVTNSRLSKNLSLSIASSVDYCQWNPSVSLNSLWVSITLRKMGCFFIVRIHCRYSSNQSHNVRLIYPQQVSDNARRIVFHRLIICRFLAAKYFLCFNYRIKKYGALNPLSSMSVISTERLTFKGNFVCFFHKFFIKWYRACVI